MKLTNPFKRLSTFELILWAASVITVVICSLFSKPLDFLLLLASVIGVTALIIVAKGDFIGQILTIVFAILYSVISVRQKYYGEMITYLFMTAPMALLSTIQWLRNPYRKNEVRIARLRPRQIAVMLLATAMVTAILGVILKYFNTANLELSTISVATSFIACYLTACRSPYYALGYAANDIVLIGLWISAATKNLSAMPMVLCFIMFLVNDCYGFFNWKRLCRKQEEK